MKKSIILVVLLFLVSGLNAQTWNGQVNGIIRRNNGEAVGEIDNSCIRGKKLPGYSSRIWKQKRDRRFRSRSLSHYFLKRTV